MRQPRSMVISAQIESRLSGKCQRLKSRVCGQNHLVKSETAIIDRCTGIARIWQNLLTVTVDRVTYRKQAV
jgi:hypothetical protein